ncbi:transglycosylase family protein [Salinicoccus jeotgali]|uniref:Transglycosylase family protein n=1 Tax=Salinicoccus jeotgali TaxID=381634 RepID=A0ABP7E5G1_9STAP
MKKTILTTTMALGLGITSLATGQSAEASAQDINKEELAAMAQNGAAELNNSPIHEGAYEYNFTLNGVDYNFESNGTQYTWSYGNYDNSVSVAPQPKAQTQEPAPKVTESYDTQETVQNNTQEQAPQQTETVETSTPEPVQETVQTQKQSAPSPQASSNGSVKEQFLAAGGTQAMWSNIVMPESSGNPSAVNHLGYRGLGQTKEHWGTGSVETQTKGMINYAQERYGSVEAAMAFRQQNNWW